MSQSRPGRHRGTPSISSYLHSRQLGLAQPLSPHLQDRVLLSKESLLPVPSCPSPYLNCIKFCPVPGHYHILAMTNYDYGLIRVKYCNLNSAQLVRNRWGCHLGIWDVAWSSVTASTLVTVGADKKVKVWDINTVRQGGEVQEFTGHTRPVMAVGWRPGCESQLATGGLDQTLMLWDLRSTGHSEAQAHTGSSVSCLTWQDDNTLVSSGSKDGVVKVWDIRSPAKPKLEISHPGASSPVEVANTSLCPSPCRNFLYVSCEDYNIYKYHMRNTQTPTAVYTGAKNYTKTSGLSPCGRYIASGRVDEEGEWAALWNTASPGGPVARLRLGPSNCHGGLGKLGCLDWSHHTDTNLATLATVTYTTVASNGVVQLWRDHRFSRLPQEEGQPALEFLADLDDNPEPKVTGGSDHPRAEEQQSGDVVVTEDLGIARGDDEVQTDSTVDVESQSRKESLDSTKVTSTDQSEPSLCMDKVRRFS